MRDPGAQMFARFVRCDRRHGACVAAGMSEARESRVQGPPVETAEALARIEAALARIESRVTTLEGQANAAVATATDTLDHWVADARGRGVDVDERLRVAMRLAERMTQPATARTLERTLDLAAEAPALVATLVDTVDGALGRARDAGFDADDRARRLLRALERLTSPEALNLLTVALDRLDVITALLNGAVLDPRTTRVVGVAGEALVATVDEGVQPAGPLGALRALGDADVKTVVGFTLRFAKNFGKALVQQRTALPARAGS
jgi:uncharacterized protein YjgD (DUF1641 family)